MRGFVVWFTGLSGAGKSTLAELLKVELEARGRHVEVLDGDEVRNHLSKGLGFSKEDRDTNIRRIGYAARLVARSGGVAITAAISPYREVRDEVRAQAPGFFEVYVCCSIEELACRDVKGLYAKALRGEIANFTGVSDPYEAPLNPEVVVDSEAESVQQSFGRIVAQLERSGHLSPGARESLADPEAARNLPRLDVGRREASDALMLGWGALAPLAGFMGSADYASVLAEGRLRSGEPFTIPVLLRTEQPRKAGRVALWAAGEPVAIVDVEDAFQTSPEGEARAIYGTEDLAHPGVRALRESGGWALAGAVAALRRPDTGFPVHDMTPLEVRRAKAERGWRTMVGSRPGTRSTGRMSTSRRWRWSPSTACFSIRSLARRNPATSRPRSACGATRRCSPATSRPAGRCSRPTRPGCATRVPRRRSSTPWCDATTAARTSSSAATTREWAATTTPTPPTGSSTSTHRVSSESRS